MCVTDSVGVLKKHRTCVCVREREIDRKKYWATERVDDREVDEDCLRESERVREREREREREIAQPNKRWFVDAKEREKDNLNGV